jgi:hypothetical protein
LAAAVPPVAFILWSGGSVVPNTLSAKAYFFAEGCIPILDKAQGLIRYMIPALASFGLLMFGFLWLVRSSLRWVTFGFAAMFLAAYLVQLPGAVTHNYFRYPTILVPFLVVGWVAALSTGLPARLRRANLVVLALSPAILLHTLPQTWTIYRNSIEHSRSELAGVASWVARNLPPTATVIVHDAGYISLEGQQSLVDLVGLKTSSSIPVNRATHWETCSRDPRAIVRIAEQTSADFIVVLELWDRIFRITDGLKDDGWTLERLDTERGDTSYRVYAIGRA